MYIPKKIVSLWNKYIFYSIRSTKKFSRKTYELVIIDNNTNNMRFDREMQKNVARPFNANQPTRLYILWRLLFGKRSTGHVPRRRMNNDSRNGRMLLKKQEKNYLNDIFGRDSVGKWSRNRLLTRSTLETLTGSCKSPREKFCQSSEPGDQPSRAIPRLCEYRHNGIYNVPLELRRFI